MGVKRKQHEAKFKAQVAMAALAGDKILAEQSAEYGRFWNLVRSKMLKKLDAEKSA